MMAAAANSQRSSRRQAVQVGLLCFVLSFCLYFATVAPSVGAGHDSAELSTCCAIQGVPHPPGYPLFVATGWLADQLPIGHDPAYRSNLLCASELAVGLGFLGAALTLWTGVVPGLLATLLTATCTAVWRQAVLTEVFALHLCFLCILILLAAVWEFGDDKRRREVMLLVFFVLGCSLAHQHIMAFAGPPFLFFCWCSRGRGRSWGFSWPALFVLLLSLMAPYSLLMFFAAQKPGINWGDPVTLHQLIEHFLRKAYGTGMLNDASLQYDARAGEAQVSTYFVLLLRTYFPFPSFLALGFALDRLCQSPRQPRIWLFIGLFLAFGPWFALIGNQPTSEFYSDLMERFYSSSMIGAGGLLAFGIEWALTCSLTLRSYQALLFLLPLYSLWTNLPRCSQRNDYYANDLMNATLAEVPPRTVFIVAGDLPGGMASYIRYVENSRPDVLFVLPGLSAAEWFLDRLPVGFARAALNQPGEEAINHETAVKNMVEYGRKHGFHIYSNQGSGLKGTFLRVGLSYRYFAPGEKIWSDAQVSSELEKNFNRLSVCPRRGDYRLNYRQPFWVRFCIQEWVEGYTAIARAIASTAPESALKALDVVCNAEMVPNYEAHINRGGLRLSFGRYEDALDDYDIALSVNPRSRIALEGSLRAYLALKDQRKVDEIKTRLSALPPG